MVLATDHFKLADILNILDVVWGLSIKRVIINHPFSQVVVATQLKYDGLNFSCIAQSIKEIRLTKSIFAIDLG